MDGSLRTRPDRAELAVHAHALREKVDGFVEDQTVPAASRLMSRRQKSQQTEAGNGDIPGIAAAAPVAVRELVRGQILQALIDRALRFRRAQILARLHIPGRDHGLARRRSRQLFLREDRHGAYPTQETHAATTQ